MTMMMTTMMMTIKMKSHFRQTPWSGMMTHVGCSDTEISVNFFRSRAYCIPVADCCFTVSSLAIAAACSLKPPNTLLNTPHYFTHQITVTFYQDVRCKQVYSVKLQEDRKTTDCTTQTSSGGLKNSAKQLTVFYKSTNKH